ncbi:uncharacterized RNA-binding protein C17H9.04c-like isoform X3 [Neltuma alba]|uniref:uncharacterized RNA-binding protein C17H9.04c-like isoform X3 n=1 Tax=Neltuma alba TaxID=207710 RepID=UPI0010A5650B|nr:uncharacterized RNA-binding protein C17H9.04c-like isoform X3 [Prosopis alba]
MSSRPGDWNCRSCQHMNFQRRESCQRCGESKYGEYYGGGGRSSSGSSYGSDVRPGDWYCAANNCGTHNFANRSSCFKCGAFKDDLLSSSFNTDFLLRSRPFPSAPTSTRPSWKSGDWICNRRSISTLEKSPSLSPSLPPSPLSSF